MKKHFILGFLAGATLFGAIGAVAIEYAITVNPYPVKVSGVETQMEGYNINDQSYFKLRDVANSVGNFRVDFVNNTIAITPIDPTPKPTPTPTPAPTKDISELKEGEAVDGIEARNVGDKWYVYQGDIKDKYKGKYDFDLKEDGTYCIAWTIDGKDIIFFDNYPQGDDFNLSVELTWYNTVLQPWLAAEGWNI